MAGKSQKAPATEIPVVEASSHGEALALQGLRRRLPKARICPRADGRLQVIPQEMRPWPEAGVSYIEAIEFAHLRADEQGIEPPRPPRRPWRYYNEEEAARATHGPYVPPPHHHPWHGLVANPTPRLVTTRGNCPRCLAMLTDPCGVGLCTLCEGKGSVRWAVTGRVCSSCGGEKIKEGTLNWCGYCYGTGYRRGS